MRMFFKELVSLLQVYIYVSYSAGTQSQARVLHISVCCFSNHKPICVLLDSITYLVNLKVMDEKV